jgi:hypothetical protein
MSLCVLVLACGAAACGGEVIDYSPTATRTPLPSRVVVDIVNIPLVSESVRILEIQVSDLGNFDERREASAKLRTVRAWIHALDAGATSRAELVEMCDQIFQQGVAVPPPTAIPGAVPPVVADWRIKEQTLAELCDEVLDDPHAHTLRGWADLIDARVFEDRE